METLKMRINQYVKLVDDETSAKKLTEKEWVMASRLGKINLKEFKRNESSLLSLKIRDKLKAFYVYIGRNNITSADKRKLLIYLCND